MKRYIKTTTSKRPYELLGWLVNDAGQYRKIFLDTYAISERQALSNFRHQVHENYPGWSIVEDKMNLREGGHPQYNRWPELPN